MMLTNDSSPAPSAPGAGHSGDRPDPLEVLYALVFVFSQGYATVVSGYLLFKEIGHVDLVQFQLILYLICFNLFILFEMLRIYHYLHAFQKISHTPDTIHFIIGMARPYVNCERFLRLGLAFLTVILFERGIVDLFISSGFSVATRKWLGSWMSIPCEYFSSQSLEVFKDQMAGNAEILGVAFILLIAWDMFVFAEICNSKKNRNGRFKKIKDISQKFFYVSPKDDCCGDLFSSRWNYFWTRKLWERLWGCWFAFFALWTFVLPEQPIILGFAIVSAGGFFMLFYNYGRSVADVKVWRDVICGPFRELISLFK